MKILLLFYLIVFYIFKTSTHGCFLTYTKEVHIVNDLPEGSALLKLHCASGDDDLGYHTLKRIEDFHWTFCENFYPSTLFFCHLWWGSKQITFDAFKSKWVEVDPKLHYWLAKSDGIYFSYFNDRETFVRIYDWE